MKTKSVKVFLSVAVLLLITWGFVSCSKKDAAPVVVKTDLISAIASANVLVTSTHEGVVGGYYFKGSQAPLVAAIAQAQGVADNATATETDVTAAKDNLAAAIATYQTNIVVEADPINLVGQWTFDEIGTPSATAKVKDYSSGNHEGALKAGSDLWFATGDLPSLAADRYGSADMALHFDKGQHVEIPYSTSLNPAAMSISLWAKQDVETTLYTEQYMVSLGRRTGYKFQYQYAPRPGFAARVVRSAGDTVLWERDSHEGALTQGTWYHIVITYGGGHQVYYVNGVVIYDWGAIPSELLPGTIVSLAAKPVNLTFGVDLPTAKYSSNASSPFYVYNGGFFHGTLDEIRIYKAVLSPAQVTSIFNLEKPSGF